MRGSTNAVSRGAFAAIEIAIERFGVFVMSMDRSLKSKASLSRHRNVLTRAERIKVLEENERFKLGETSPFGLPKVAHRKAAVGGKTKKAAPKEGEAAAAPDAAAAAAAAAPAAGAAPAAKDKPKDKGKGKGKD